MPLIDRQGDVQERALGEVIGPAEASCAALGAATAATLVFDGVMDGKAFSAAALLRAEGFTGTLVGIGPVGLDRLAQGFRVGFDLLELTEGELTLLKPCHLQPFPHPYQPDRQGEPDFQASA